MKKNGLRVNRVGFATRGGCRLAEEDIRRVLDSGIDFLNWCGHPDALSRTIARLGPRRRDVTICVQFDARTALAAEAELHAILTELGTDYIDAITFYYVESRSEWEQIIGPSGAYEFCDKAKQHGKIRFIGLTTHQRWLAAETVQSGLLDLLMIRYNAAHRGAEKEVFPITDRLGIPVVVYTCLRWGALLRPTPDDPPGFVVPNAPAWYRFALASPSVSVALMAPNSRAELEEDLTVLQQPVLSESEYELLAQHGERVYRHAGSFP